MRERRERTGAGEPPAIARADLDAVRIDAFPQAGDEAGAAIGLLASALVLNLPLEGIKLAAGGRSPLMLGFAAGGAMSALLFRLQMHVLLIFFPTRDGG